MKTHSIDIRFFIYLFIFYSIWTLRTTLIQYFFITAALHCPYSGLKFLIFTYTCL